MTDDRNNDISFFLDRFKADPGAPALAWRGATYSYGWLLESIEARRKELEDEDVSPGMPVVLTGDYSPTTVSFLLALTLKKAIIIPMLPSTVDHSPDLVDLADPALVIDVASDEEVTFTRRRPGAPNRLYRELVECGAPGLVLFTSGSTGHPKAAVHDFSRLLRKFKKRRPAMVTLNFLLFDHWGGLNTLLHCLSNCSLVVLPETRSPDHICDLLEQHKIELLPATPTFLNLLLISRAYRSRDLSNLRLISYGAEPMPNSTLSRLHEEFPDVELRQTYGLIELGVLRAKSRESGSLWVKIGGDGYDTRVVDGILQIKAESAMLGYLNAPSPFTDDGYFITGDRVEVDGEFLHILGRDSDLINVGGQKVYPTEVEAVLLDCQDVEDAVVYGERNAITGHIVCADVKLGAQVKLDEARINIKRFCGQRLEPFKVPVRIRLSTDAMYGHRLKRMRRRPEPG